VSFTNNCSSEVITYNITYTAPVGPCGPRINPGNAEWQFCLVTPSGTYNRNDLASNPGFTYSGPASSVYFLPIAGGGDVILNGSPYAVQNGTYYLFEGNINITVSSNQPGALGHWTLCIETNQAPTFGKGNNRPQSPCEVGKSLQNDGGKGSGTEGGNRGTGVTQPSKKPATEPIKPQGTSGTVRPTNTTRPSNTAKPTTTTRPTGGVSAPVKEVEKVDTNATKEKVSQPIERPVGGN
jgi:hypothetical protein